MALEKPNTTGKTGRIAIGVSVLFNITILVILFTPVIEWLHKPLRVSEQPQPSDLIVILSGGAYDVDGGLPNFNTFVRLRKGLELYRHGYADHIICAGANRLPDSGKSIGRVMKETLVSQGLPEPAIEVFDEVPGDFEYYDNLMAMVDRYKDRHDFNRTMIVTSTGNALRIKKSFLKKGYNPLLITSGDYQFKPYNWHNRFEFFQEIGNEYFAFALFWALGRF